MVDTHVCWHPRMLFRVHEGCVSKGEQWHSIRSHALLLVHVHVHVHVHVSGCGLRSVMEQSPVTTSRHHITITTLKVCSPPRPRQLFLPRNRLPVLHGAGWHKACTMRALYFLFCFFFGSFASKLVRGFVRDSRARGWPYTLL